MASPFNRTVLPFNLCIQSNGETWCVLCSEAYLVRLPCGGVGLRYLVQPGEVAPPNRWMASSSEPSLPENASVRPDAPQETVDTRVDTKARVRKQCNVAGCTLQVQGCYIREPDALGLAGPRCKRHGAMAYKCGIPGCALDCRRRMKADAIGEEGRRCERHGATRISTKRRQPGGTPLSAAALVEAADGDLVIVEDGLPEHRQQDQSGRETGAADSTHRPSLVADEPPQSHQEPLGHLDEAIVFVADCQGAAWVYGALVKKAWEEEDGYVCMEIQLCQPGPEFRRLTEAESLQVPIPDLKAIRKMRARANRRFCSSTRCVRRSQGKNSAGAPSCIHHGAIRRKCAVESCGKSAQGKKVLKADGSLAYRCSSHGGSKTMCGITGRHRQAQGGKARVSTQDGALEARCRAHAAGR